MRLRPVPSENAAGIKYRMSRNNIIHNKTVRNGCFEINTYIHSVFFKWKNSKYECCAICFPEYYRYCKNVFTVFSYDLVQTFVL